MPSIKMPSKYAVCKAEEMEYDGSGFDWQKFGEIAGIVVGTACFFISATRLCKCAGDGYSNIRFMYTALSAFAAIGSGYLLDQHLNGQL